MLGPIWGMVPLGGLESMPELTYKQRLSVVWLLLWRTFLGTILSVFALLFLVDGVINLLAINETVSGYKTIIALGAYPISLFLIGPFVVGAAVRKSFNGFRLQILRDETAVQRDPINPKL